MSVPGFRSGFPGLATLRLVADGPRGKNIYEITSIGMDVLAVAMGHAREGILSIGCSITGQNDRSRPGNLPPG